MNEIRLLRALHIAESNLRIGYSARASVQKAVELLQVNTADLALVLLEKTVGCANARVERAVLDAVDRVIERAPARQVGKR